MKIDANKPMRTRQISAQQELGVLELADNIALKSFAHNLDRLPVVRMSDQELAVKASKQSRFFRVTKLVYDSDENNLHKLTSVYSAAAAIHANPAIILVSDGQTAELYLGICADPDRNTVFPKAQTLYRTVVGNFPGSLEADMDDAFISKNDQLEAILNHCIPVDGAMASVTGVASLREDETDSNEAFSQGLEKLIDAMRGVPFSALFIANAVEPEELARIKAEYEQLYTALSPMAQQVQTINASRSESISVQTSRTVSDTKGESASSALSVGTSETHTDTEGASYTHTNTAGVNTSFNVGGHLTALVAGVNAGKSVGVNYSHSYSRTKFDSHSVAHGTNQSETNTIGTNTAHTDSVTTGDGKTDTTTLGESLQVTYENKTIQFLQQTLEQQLERIRACESYGMFAASAYFFAPNKPDAEMAACAYKSLISGRQTGLEAASVNAWTKENRYSDVSAYLRRLRHPEFQLDLYNRVTPASLVSAQELAIQMSLPNQSTPGVTVIESAAFGRNITKTDVAREDDQIRLGSLYHMGQTTENAVKLDVQSLAMHTFVTGSTGAGKSNTVFQLLSQLRRKKVGFLVVEPAKGEYKHVFGNDVQVYGTNPNVSELLRIDPFRFPKDIHILEHLDRLVEIFNVCWPMYAAMPAVLKDAIERAYAGVGWDLRTSTNRYDDSLFPTFADVLEQIEIVLNESAFSAENKGDYTGALTVRLRSLTNGINGMIFTHDALPDAELFDRNVIVDLSRVGSTETKALIMGLLVMQLQEYRMVQSKGESRPLQHVTVLEEAHNLLKRTSTEQSAESSNLAGKSVEMLANAIAEMRAFGEGFIIADQAPGLMDMSVIRNTNTKIIMRLPDQGDRELVGRAAGLNDSQIVELSRLGMGVAAVYQNDWLEAVLCKVDYYEPKQTARRAADTRAFTAEDTAESAKIITAVLQGKVDKLDPKTVLRSSLSARCKYLILDAANAGSDTKMKQRSAQAVYTYFRASELLGQKIRPKDKAPVYRRKMTALLQEQLEEFPAFLTNKILLWMVQEQSLRDSTFVQLYNAFANELRPKGGVQ